MSREEPRLPQLARIHPALLASKLHHCPVKLWAIYSQGHAEMNIYGDREGLHALAVASAQADRLELPLDEPPVASSEFGREVASIRVDPSDEGDPRICFVREGSVCVLSGSSRELSRIVASSIAELADGPETENGVGSHVHLDPTSDPDRQFYSPDSGSLVVGFDTHRGR